MHLGVVLERDAGLTVREIGQETIIVSENGDTLHTLNEVGQHVWRALDGQRRLSDVLQLVCSDFAVEETVAEADLLAFAGQLVEKRLVIVKNG